MVEELLDHLLMELVEIQDQELQEQQTLVVVLEVHQEVDQE